MASTDLLFSQLPNPPGGLVEIVFGDDSGIPAGAVELLASGGIVAIKGLGGFHLACNAANEQAVVELRRRKRRSNKPLAVMVRSLADAGRLCHIDDAERDLLAGSIRPIVLLRRRTVDEGNGSSPDALALAPSVARDLPELGVMLPYTPLQHLLLAAAEVCALRTLLLETAVCCAAKAAPDSDDAETCGTSA